jgi:lipid A 3-O-deacylase
MAVLPRLANKTAVAAGVGAGARYRHRLWSVSLRLRFGTAQSAASTNQWDMSLLRILTFAFAVLIGLAGADAALAQSSYVPTGLEIRAGVLAHDVPDLWSGFRLESGVDINAELLGPGIAFLGGALRPAIGGSVNTSGYTSKAYLDARWEIEGRYGIFFGLGLGAAIHDGNLNPTEPDRKALGSRVLFHVPVELGYRWDEHQSLSVYFEHTSNGNTARYNEALDNIGIRYGYRF